MRIFLILVVSVILGASCAAIAGSVPAGPAGDNPTDENEFGRAVGEWVDSSFKLTIEVAEAYQSHPKLDPALIDIENRTKFYGIGLTNVGFNAIFIAGRLHTLEEVGITYSYDPYKRAELMMPSQWNNIALIGEGDNIDIRLGWLGREPVFFIKVPPRVQPPPPEPLPPPPTPKLKVVSIERNDDTGEVIITVKNRGNAVAKGEGSIKVGLSYATNWVAEWFTYFHSVIIGMVEVGPDETLTLTFQMPEEIPQDVLQAFYDHLKNMWTGYKDPDHLDYLCFAVTLRSNAGTWRTWGYLPLR
jgi:hypothetical protein